MVIKVLLADDQALVRGAMGALLELDGDIRVVAEVGRGDQVLDAARECRPQVCLLDIQMPGQDGIETARQIREELPEIRVLMVTTFNRAGYLRAALDAGAAGFVVKDAPAAQLADAVRRVAQGLRVVDPVLAAESLLDGPNPLTGREIDALRLPLDGLSVKAMASRLFLSPGTIRNHLSSAIGKTGAENRVDAAQRAASRGWL